jgi:hypothetical protein
MFLAGPTDAPLQSHRRVTAHPVWSILLTAWGVGSLAPTCLQRGCQVRLRPWLLRQVVDAMARLKLAHARVVLASTLNV